MFEYINPSGLLFPPLTKRAETKMIVLHHSATTSATLKAMHDYHITKGMNGLAYNIVVFKNGEIYWGRGLDMVGGHTSDTSINKISVGICAIGNFEIETMGSTQKEALKKLIRELLKYYPTINAIKGHKEVTATACPGKNYPLAEMKALLNEDTHTNGGSDYTSDSTLIKEGQTGEQVKQLQQNLKSIVYDPKGIDGIFGPNTKAAVIAFQTAMGLERDGIVGPITAGALKEVLARPTVQNGSNGYAVRQLQTVLKNKGYDPKGVDAIFGQNTEAAVRKFQAARKIVIDGVVGPQTWGEIYK